MNAAATTASLVKLNFSLSEMMLSDVCLILHVFLQAFDATQRRRTATDIEVYQACAVQRSPEKIQKTCEISDGFDGLRLGDTTHWMRFVPKARDVLYICIYIYIAQYVYVTIHHILMNYVSSD